MDKREEFRKEFNKQHPNNKAVSAVSIFSSVNNLALTLNYNIYWE